MTAASTIAAPRRLVDSDAEARARAAAVEEAVADLGPDAGADAVGEHTEAVLELGGGLTHYFAARQGGYRGWRWSVTLAWAGGSAPHGVDPDGVPSGDNDSDSHGSDSTDPGDVPVTISEVVLVPGPDALIAPTWLPWDERIRPGDLGVGDLLPVADGDERLAPGYLASDDPAVEEIAVEIGLGRATVLSRAGRDEIAQRWQDGPRGPHTEMARAAPGACGTCGFLLPLAGSMRAAFGVCANEYGPADGTVVAVGFGCGAHSAVALEPMSPVAVAELVYDDGIDLESMHS